jgi:isoquinoline 1-oxidoreductase subunit beta
LQLSSLLTRRTFLRTSAAAGGSLLVAFHLPRAVARARAASSTDKPFAPNAWLEIAPAGEIKIWCGRSEIGQGVRTNLPMIVAEELCCDWKKVQVVQADLDSKYGEQLTGGSLSTRTSYTNLRKAGAAAREMLISAAADEWQVERSECQAENSTVLHPPTKRTLSYGQLTARASAILPPLDPPLKNPADFKLIGKPTRRTDTPLKVTGSAVFGLDVRVPGMLFASVERSPVYGGSPRSFNADEVKTAPHVRAVFELKSAHLTHQFGETSGPGSRNYSCAGVAIVADSTWAAM